MLTFAGVVVGANVFRDVCFVSSIFPLDDPHRRHYGKSPTDTTVRQPPSRQPNALSDTVLLFVSVPANRRSACTQIYPRKTAERWPSFCERIRSDENAPEYPEGVEFPNNRGDGAAHEMVASLIFEEPRYQNIRVQRRAEKCVARFSEKVQRR